MDERALQLEVESSRAARLRAWAVLVELRAISTGGQELAKPAEKSFEKEGEILERELRKALVLHRLLSPRSKPLSPGWPTETVFFRMPINKHMGVCLQNIR
jgi:hypothetical protein